MFLQIIVILTIIGPTYIFSGGQQNPPEKNPLGHNSPSLLPYMGRLGSGPDLVGQIGSGVWVSAS